MNAPETIGATLGLAVMVAIIVFVFMVISAWVTELWRYSRRR